MAANLLKSIASTHQLRPLSLLWFFLIFCERKKKLTKRFNVFFLQLRIRKRIFYAFAPSKLLNYAQHMAYFYKNTYFSYMIYAKRRPRIRQTDSRPKNWFFNSLKQWSVDHHLICDHWFSIIWYLLILKVIFVFLIRILRLKVRFSFRARMTSF